ncbi:hypothetical protein Tco_0263954, partial [Tanacetum coccineum]
LQKKVKRLEKALRARTPGMKLFKIGTFRRKSLDKKNVSKQGRNLKTRPMFEEDDFDDNFKYNVEGDTINAGGAVNTPTTGVSAASVSISTAEPRTPPTTTTTSFEDEDLTIAQTLVKMRSEKAKEKELLSEMWKNLLDLQQFFQLLIQNIKAKALCKNLKSLQRTQERLRFRWMKSWL